MAFDTQDTNTIVTLHSSGGERLPWRRSRGLFPGRPGEMRGGKVCWWGESVQSNEANESTKMTCVRWNEKLKLGWNDTYIYLVMWTFSLLIRQNEQKWKKHMRTQNNREKQICQVNNQGLSRVSKVQSFFFFCGDDCSCVHMRGKARRRHLWDPPPFLQHN